MHTAEAQPHALVAGLPPGGHVEAAVVPHQPHVVAQGPVLAYVVVRRGHWHRDHLTGLWEDRENI